jgi:hypothetical protein
MEDKGIGFVARHYREGMFSVKDGWRRLGIGMSVRMRRYRIAAAVSAVVVLSASAAIIYHEYRGESEPQHVQTVQTVNPMAEVKVIDFENAPLPEVVKKIESVYGVKVMGMPESPEHYELSLHYEGTPTDLISTINEILGTQMTVTEK